MPDYSDYSLICLILDVHGPLRSNVLLELAKNRGITKTSFYQIMKLMRKRSRHNDIRHYTIKTTPRNTHIFYYCRRDKGRRAICRIAEFMGIDAHDFLKGSDLKELHALESLPPRRLQHIPKRKEHRAELEAERERLWKSIKGVDPLEDQ